MSEGAKPPSFANNPDPAVDYGQHKGSGGNHAGQTAPAGETFGEDNPVINSPMMGTTGGYSPRQ